MRRNTAQQRLPNTAPDLEVLKGEIESLRHFGDDFFGVATLRRPNGDGTATIVGKLVGINLGDSVEVRGAWTEHERYGPQFRAKEVRTVIPSDASGIVAWLSSRLPDVGRQRAVELVERFGAEGIWGVIEHRPDDLLEVAGITPARRDAIVEAYRTHRAERDQMVRLKGWGLSDHQIATILQRWGDRADEVLRENPYRLCDEVRGFGFRRADQVARRMGLSLESPPRIRAGLVHVLEEAAGHGHSYVTRQTLVKLAAKLLQVPPQIVTRHVDAVLEGGRAVERRGRIYRPAIDRAEARVADGVRALSGGRKAS